MGLAVGLAGNVKAQGEIWDDADAQFNNYTYSYRVFHTRLAIKGKLLATECPIVTPWLSASLGVAFNVAHGFNNTPTIAEAVPNSNFTSHEYTALTYTIGAGLQKELTPHWSAGIGYEFTDYGKSELGRAPDQTLNHGLGMNHLYTQGLLFNLTYLS